MTRAEKIRATVIEKYGSWEAFKQIRYYDPSKAETRKRVAALGGKATTSRPFRDNKELAREAYKKGIGRKHEEKRKST